MSNDVISFTPEQISEVKKCMDDVLYFIRNYVKIMHPVKGEIPFDLYDYQEDIIKLYRDNLYSILLAPRQMGKCCSPETKIRVRNKRTGEVIEISMGEFHEKMLKGLRDD